MDRAQAIERADKVLGAWNSGDADGVVEFTAPDAVFEDIAVAEPVHGREAIRRLVQGYMDAFPDLKVTIDSQLFDDNRLVQEWTCTATHEGELMGIPATHKSVRFRGCAIVTFSDDGTLQKTAQYWGVLSLLTQIGAVPERIGTQTA